MKECVKEVKTLTLKAEDLRKYFKLGKEWKVTELEWSYHITIRDGLVIEFTRWIK